MLVSAMVLAAVASHDSPTVRAIKLVLPKDTTGRALITGEADVLVVHNGSFHFYFNSWVLGNAGPARWI